MSAAHLKAARLELHVGLPLPERLLAGLTSYLGQIDADFSLARAFIAQAESATTKGRAALLRAQQSLRAHIEMWIDDVRRQYPEVSQPDDRDVTLMMSGLTGFIVAPVRAERPFIRDDFGRPDAGWRSSSDPSRCSLGISAQNGPSLFPKPLGALSRSGKGTGGHRDRPGRRGWHGGFRGRPANHDCWSSS